MKDLRNEKFEKIRKEAEIKQLEKLRNHPHIPDDFDWQDYIFLNQQILSKGFNTEYLALRHWLKQGRRNGLKYRIDKESLDQIKIYYPEKNLEESSEKNIESEIKRKAVYTCISGKYDTLKKINFKDNEWEYICFSNTLSPGKRDGWEIREIPEILNPLDQVRKARAIKILPHLFLPEYDETIWIDGTIEVISPPDTFIKKYIKSSDIFAIATHPDRICVYDEKDACIRYGKDDAKILNKQVQEYEKEGYPKNWGMVQSGIIYRKNVEVVKTFSSMWWSQVLKYSKRDQMSFNYTLWKMNIPIRPLKPSIICSDYFWLWTHNTIDAKRARFRKDYESLKNYLNGKDILHNTI